MFLFLIVDYERKDDDDDRVKRKEELHKDSEYLYSLDLEKMMLDFLDKNDPSMSDDGSFTAGSFINTSNDLKNEDAVLVSSKNSYQHPSSSHEDIFPELAQGVVPDPIKPSFGRGFPSVVIPFLSFTSSVGAFSVERSTVNMLGQPMPPPGIPVPIQIGTGPPMGNMASAISIETMNSMTPRASSFYDQPLHPNFNFPLDNGAKGYHGHANYMPQGQPFLSTQTAAHPQMPIPNQNQEWSNNASDYGWGQLQNQSWKQDHGHTWGQLNDQQQIANEIPYMANSTIASSGLERPIVNFNSNYVGANENMVNSSTAWEEVSNTTNTPFFRPVFLQDIEQRGPSVEDKQINLSEESKTYYDITDAPYKISENPSKFSSTPQFTTTELGNEKDSKNINHINLNIPIQDVTSSNTSDFDNKRDEFSNVQENHAVDSAFASIIKKDLKEDIDLNKPLTKRQKKKLQKAARLKESVRAREESQYVSGLKHRGFVEFETAHSKPVSSASEGKDMYEVSDTEKALVAASPVVLQTPSHKRFKFKKVDLNNMVEDMDGYKDSKNISESTDTLNSINDKLGTGSRTAPDQQPGFNFTTISLNSSSVKPLREQVLSSGIVEDILERVLLDTLDSKFDVPSLSSFEDLESDGEDYNDDSDLELDEDLGISELCEGLGINTDFDFDNNDDMDRILLEVNKRVEAQKSTYQQRIILFKESIDKK